MFPRQVAKEEVIENLKKIFSRGGFSEPSREKEGYIKMGDKIIKKKFEVLEEGIEYIYDKEDGEIFIPIKNREIDIKDRNSEIYQARDGEYTLIVINTGEENQHGLLIDAEGKIIAEMINYRRSKNKIIGLKVEDDKVLVFAESKASIGDKKIFYKLEIEKDRYDGQPDHYNVSAL